ncbi:MAG: twin-arginine translocation signal domain-containing protein [Coriobacteriia bacterium]|nr:twin-arginine translocation signal domain-containing protein [Coriobacteriia bacterium]
MATKDKNQGGKFELSRRDFVKAGAAAAAVGAVGLDFVARPSRADAAAVSATYHTTCPYCSASCGQLVDVDSSGNVLDIYGDHMAPWNDGGLCAKGAGAYQLVNNERRLGVPEATNVDGDDWYNDTARPTATDIAWKRTGDGAWSAIGLDQAMDEAAAAMVAARGPVVGADTLYSLFTAGDTIGTVTYTGFSGLATMKLPDGSYTVTTNGNKVDQATLLGLLAGLPGTAPALAAAFDGLVFSATDPVERSSYTFLGVSDLGAKALAANVFANTGDFVYDGGTYYAYLVDAGTGNMHVATSPDMLVWTYVGDLGKPAGVSGMTSPTVLKNGAALRVWYVDVVAQKLQYATYDGTVWSAAANVTVGGTEPVWFVGHPLIAKSGTTLTLHYVLGGGGIKKATAPDTTPAIFAAASNVYDNAANSEGNVSAGLKGIAFSTYAQPDPTDTGWAFSDIKSLMFSNKYNSQSIAFFGSSHINNEPNYLYRRLIAQFGTTNVEHQARI